jgi:peptidoglycan-associated lipoprotein
MLSVMRVGRSAKFAAVLMTALALSACASQQSQTGLEGTAAQPGSQQDFVVNVGDRVFFAVDHTDLSPEARGVLDRQAKWLQTYPNYTVTVEGHADERGTREYNFALGERRSTTTRDYLISRGVQPSRLKTISYGKERPVAVCEEESCFNQNRRAVTVLNGR